ncbi:N-acetylmuramic acid 6-phosphate etherase [Aquimarina agarilytica]|uniref:N-acetylmuramic acid 6-phosphate etherase n=1 Tax=Aquimarina agarilytica TaxID=1087449 RepID=UPI000288061F|nr:N-acetylmuramic acid 6-phosphate etherase [Aquimarina agarilytica]
MDFKKITEQESNYTNLEQMTALELIQYINNEDKTVAFAVENALPQITTVIETAVKLLQQGGRIFYMGAGTSGRLGVVDASECPPTFGVSHELVQGIIAGGDKAIRKAVENAEDSTTQGWVDLENKHISTNDIVIGIAASGTTPYVIHALKSCNKNQITTACITCNPKSPLALEAKLPIEIKVGPEFVTGSSRMKAGTAQKMALNMISTATMIQLGKVKGNRMVDMQLSNDKLVERAILMLMDTANIKRQHAEKLIKKYGNVRQALDTLQ